MAYIILNRTNEFVTNCIAFWRSTGFSWEFYRAAAFCTFWNGVRVDVGRPFSQHSLTVIQSGCSKCRASHIVTSWSICQRRWNILLNWKKPTVESFAMCRFIDSSESRRTPEVTHYRLRLGCVYNFTPTAGGHDGIWILLGVLLQISRLPKPLGFRLCSIQQATQSSEAIRRRRVSDTFHRRIFSKAWFDRPQTAGMRCDADCTSQIFYVNTLGGFMDRCLRYSSRKSVLD